MPKKNEKHRGGHAICAIGYDDDKVIKHGNGVETKGAIRFANSWGTNWGDKGFGWMPYEYIHKGLATDWWVMMNAEWLALSPFQKRG